MVLLLATAAVVFIAPAVVLGRFVVVGSSVDDADFGAVLLEGGSSLVLVLAVMVAAFLLCFVVLPASTFLPLLVPLGVVGRLLFAALEVVEEAPALVSAFSALRVAGFAAAEAAAAVRCLILADDDD